ARHVRARDLGPRGPAARPRPGPPRDQAALLHERGAGLRLRLGDQGVGRRGADRTPGRPRGAAPLPELWLRPRPRHHLPGRSPPRTFSVTFPEDPVFDEARFSRPVARQLGSVHTEIPLTRAQVLSALAPALDYLDEPFADPSLLPCFEIAREARRHVKVVLSGD